jgi:hypothetical protein
VSYGEQAVGRSFNPSGNPLVDSIKEKYAAIIDSLNDMRATASDGEEKRLLSVAITEAQTAQMWAVKAVTFAQPKGDGNNVPAGYEEAHGKLLNENADA